MPGALPTIAILQDGICEPLVIKRKQAPSLSAAPNPFSTATVLLVNVPSDFDGKHFTIKLFDVLGNSVRTIADRNLPAGTYQFQINAANLPGNNYLAVLELENQLVTKALLFIR
jgi:hypothetical protein